MKERIGLFHWAECNLNSLLYSNGPICVNYIIAIAAEWFSRHIVQVVLFSLLSIVCLLTLVTALPVCLLLGRLRFI